MRQATSLAVTRAAKFLRKFLWPPPMGANAATLRLMCSEGDADMVQTLLSAGVPAGGKDAIDIIGLAPMHYAAKSPDNVASVRMLVEFEADVNYVGGIGGEAPLHIAACQGSVKAAKALMQARADVEQRDKGGQTALHHAARIGCLPLVRALVQARADMLARDSPPEQTPLHLAAWYGREKVVLFMLQAKMDVDPEDLRSQTPQTRATQQGFDAVANIFEAERVRREEAAFRAEHGGAPAPAPAPTPAPAAAAE